MEPVEVQPLVEDDCWEISRTRAGLSGEPADADPGALERRLRWLTSANPARLDEVPQQLEQVLAGTGVTTFAPTGP